MRRPVLATVLALIALPAIVGSVAARPADQPASCAGYLAAYANPNNAWVIQNVVRPAAADLGVTVGQLISFTAAEQGGSLEACIPEA